MVPLGDRAVPDVEIGPPSNAELLDVLPVGTEKELLKGPGVKFSFTRYSFTRWPLRPTDSCRWWLVMVLVAVHPMLLCLVEILL